MQQDNVFQMAASNIRFGAGCTAEIGMDLRDMSAQDLAESIDLANAISGTAGFADASIAGIPAGTVIPLSVSATYDVDVTFDVGGLQQLAVALLSTDDYDAIATKR